jgi:CheY-like chemotaxis protein
VHLPYVIANAPSAARQRRQRLPRGSENILMIDDEVSVCEIARDMLSGLGYTVHIVHNGKEGTEYYRTRQGTIDLVLLDINMPVMGGKEAFDLLRSVNPSIRIMIVTGYGKEAVEMSRFSTPVNGFVQKPFQLETLAMKVRDVLDARTVPQEAIAEA